MARRNDFQGITVTDSYLTVHFIREVGTTIRFAEVKVPIGALLTDDVMKVMDKTIRRRLVEAWSAEMEGPGLF